MTLTLVGVKCENQTKLIMTARSISKRIKNKEREREREKDKQRQPQFVPITVYHHTANHGS
jgi:hypothetical protein